MTKAKARATPEESLARVLHPGPGALKDGTLARRSELFAIATSKAPGKAMVYGAQAKPPKGSK